MKITRAGMQLLAGAPGRGAAGTAILLGGAVAVAVAAAPLSSASGAASVAPVPTRSSAARPAPPEPFAEPVGATLEMTARVANSNDMLALLRKSGMSQPDAKRAADLLAEVGADAVADGTPVVLVLGQGASGAFDRLERITLQQGPTLKVEIGRTRLGELQLVRDVLPVDASPRRFRGEVGANLFWSLRAAGVPPEAAGEFVAAVTSRLDLRRDLRPGDRFDLVIDHLKAQDGRAQPGPILYAAIDQSTGRDLHLVRWTVGGRTGWFDPRDKQQRAEGFEHPVSGPVSSRFGYRVHPILGIGRFHQGVDMKAAWGTPVVAPDDGHVVQAAWNGGYGRQVQLVHASGLETSFSHLSSYAVAPGASVRRGDVIGYVGSTGFSTGAHLHYEVRRGGRPVDPMSVRHSSVEVLSPVDTAALKARLAQLRAI